MAGSLANRNHPNRTTWGHETMKEHRRNISEMKRSRDLFSLVNETRSPRSRRRRQTLEAILELAREGNIGPEEKVDIPGRMGELLGDGDAKSRELAGDILLELVNSDRLGDVMDTLDTALELPSSIVRIEALSVLGRFEEDIIDFADPPSRLTESILPLLLSEEPSVSLKAARTLRILIHRGSPTSPIGAGEISAIIRLVQCDDPATITEVSRLLGTLAMFGRALDVINAGGIEACVGAFDRCGIDVEVGVGYFLWELVEAGSVDQVVLKDGAPILERLIRVGAWDVGPEIIEQLDGMHDPRATHLVEAIVSRKGLDLERDTFRDVYQYLSGPDLETNEDRMHTLRQEWERKVRAEDGENPEADGTGEKENKPGLIKGYFMFIWEILKFAFKLAGGSPQRDNGGVREGHSKQSGSHVHETTTSIEDLPDLIESMGNASDEKLIEILNELQAHDEAGHHDMIIHHNGVTAIMDNSIRENPEIARLSRRLINSICKSQVWWPPSLNAHLVGQLSAYLDSTDPRSRYSSLEHLQTIMDTYPLRNYIKNICSRKIVALLDDEEPDIRLAAIAFVGELGSARAIRPLKQIIESGDEDPEIVALARDSLEKLS